MTRAEIPLFRDGICSDPVVEPLFDPRHPTYPEGATIACYGCPMVEGCHNNRLNAMLDLGRYGVGRTVVAGHEVNTHEMTSWPVGACAPAHLPPFKAPEPRPLRAGEIVIQLTNQHGVPLSLAREWQRHFRETASRKETPDDFAPIAEIKRWLDAALLPTEQLSDYTVWRVAITHQHNVGAWLDAARSQAKEVAAERSYLSAGDALDMLARLTPDKMAERLAELDERLAHIHRACPNRFGIKDSELYPFFRNGGDYAGRVLRFIRRRAHEISRGITDVNLTGEEPSRDAVVRQSSE